MTAANRLQISIPQFSIKIKTLSNGTENGKMDGSPSWSSLTERQAVVQTGEAAVESLLVASPSLGEFWGANGSHFDIRGEFAKTPLLC